MTYDTAHRVKMVLALIEKGNEFDPVNRFKVSYFNINYFRCGFGHRWPRTRLL